jgi:hypothetical protein
MEKQNMEQNFYTKGEEIANAITHGVGTVLAIAALVLLVVFSAERGTAWHVVSFSIFGAALVILYFDRGRHLKFLLFHSAFISIPGFPRYIHVIAPWGPCPMGIMTYGTYYVI